MKQFTHRVEVRTDGKGLYNVTQPIEGWVRQCGLQTGLLTVFLQHTSASLTVQENADPDVVLDLADFFHKLVPDNPRLYRHTIEGPDDMPAHLRAVFTQVEVTVPVRHARCALGTWQGIFLWEHRLEGQAREVLVTVWGT